MASDTTQTEDVVHLVQRTVISKYSGSKTVIRADIWLNCFIVGTKAQTDEQRIITMMSYITDEALNWYGTDIAPFIDDIQWSQVKEKFLARFGQPIADPLVEAQHRRLKGSESVQTYFEDKVNLLNRAGITEERIIAQLTDGMPYNYRINLLCSKPKTTYEWLSTALQLEAVMRTKSSPIQMNIRQKNYQNKPKGSVSLLASPSSGQSNSSNRKPFSPCKFCLKAGETQFHWHNECPRNSRNRPTRAQQSNDNATTTQQNSDQSLMSLNSSDQGNDLSGHH